MVYRRRSELTPEELEAARARGRAQKRRWYDEHYRPGSTVRKRARAAAIAARRAEKAAAKEVARKALAARVAANAAARLERTPLLQRAWRAANPDYMREYGRAWRQLNAEKERARKRRRKQAKRVGIRDRLFKLQRGRCAYCRKKLVVGEVHLDHVVPLALGGVDKFSNLQLACAPCNQAKHATAPEAFAREKGMLV